MTDLTDAFKLAAETWPERVKTMEGVERWLFWEVYDSSGQLLVCVHVDDDTENLDRFLSALPVPVEAWAEWSRPQQGWVAVRWGDGRRVFSGEGFPTKREAYLAAVDSAIRWAVDEWKRRNP